MARSETRIYPLLVQAIGAAFIGLCLGAICGFLALVGIGLVYFHAPTPEELSRMVITGPLIGAPIGAVLGLIARIVRRSTPLFYLAAVSAGASLAGALVAAGAVGLVGWQEMGLLVLIPGALAGYTWALIRLRDLWPDRPNGIVEADELAS
jgi:hypothetical protein